MSLLSVTDTTQFRFFPSPPPLFRTQVITELIFNGVFNDLDPAQTAALLSALIFTEKCDEGACNTFDTFLLRCKVRW